MGIFLFVPLPKLNCMLIYAHRGDQSRFPENTIAAFEAAAEYPNVGIEMDVQITQDGQLVVFHDDNLMRLCNVNGKIADFTLSKLQCFPLKGQHLIPTLQDVLEAYTGNGRINIEIKDSQATAALIEFLKKYKQTHPAAYKRILLSCFEKQPLLDCAKELPNLERAFLSVDFTPEVLAFAQLINAAALHVQNEKVTQEIIDLCHQNNFRLTTWTVNSPERIAELKAWNIDGIITDFPHLV